MPNGDTRVFPREGHDQDRRLGGAHKYLLLCELRTDFWVSSAMCTILEKRKTEQR
jgi:hypothetical protein